MDTIKQTRKKRLAKNTVSSLTLQITTVICGFILPRLILHQFGSDVNGLVNSILQFLQIIAFLELGVGAVVQSALYKPLADKNSKSISEIIVSANKFFQKIAIILIVYVVILVCFYPLLVNKNFSHLFSATLILAMSISYFAQYYFGVVDRLLLTADQRGYIQYTAQTITLILNTVACAVLIEVGASIQLVKLTTSLIYLIRPIILRVYVNKYYSIDRKAEYKAGAIKQKWNGIAQHISAVVLDMTDSIVLTVFSSLANVSIYSVYHLVIYGVKNLLISVNDGIKSLFGELWAKQELGELKKTFSFSEWGIHTSTVLVFGCTGILVLPFVRVYTNGITDANYFQPAFAALLTVAHASHCLRLPYNCMILAGGHYKQTQSNYIIAAILNVVVSIVVVKVLGLVGVAIGTLAAMVYQTIWMAVYVSKNLLKWPFRNFLKQLTVDIVTVLIGIFATIKIPLLSVSYFSWVILAAEVFVVWLIIIAIINMLFYRENMSKTVGKFLHRLKKK